MAPLQVERIDPLHTLAIVIFPLLLFLLLNLAKQQNEHEPPQASSTIPFFGHLIAIYHKGPDYFRLLQQRTGSEIYTVRIFGNKLYMICSPEWVTAVHKAHKTVTFNELIVNTMQKVFLLDDCAIRGMRENKHGEERGCQSLTMDIHEMTAASLARGNNLKAMTEAVLQEEAARINGLARDGTVSTVKLWEWIRTNLTQAATTAIYGPNNPYAMDPTLVDDFWQFDSSFISLALTSCPTPSRRKAIRARDRLFSAFTTYISQHRIGQANAWIQKRLDLCRAHSLPDDMTARFEVSNNIAILSNTIPTAFWLLCFIFSDPSLLADIRAELDHRCTASPGTISDLDMKTKCPLFTSTFRETLRYVARLNSARIVVADTVLSHPTTGASYLLRRGSMVQIMTDLIHFDAHIYGPDAAGFNPRRFLHTTSPDPAAPFKDDRGKSHPASFRSLGSGNAICLGRHFAQSEIMGLAAIFVAGFEITGKNGDAFGAPPMSRGMPVLGGVLRPQHDVEVCVRRRRGYEEVRWSFEV